VERTLLSVAFDFDFDLDSVPITEFRIVPDREGHDVQSCRKAAPQRTRLQPLRSRDVEFHLRGGTDGIGSILNTRLGR